MTNLPDELLELVKEHYNLVGATENVAAPGGGLKEITGISPAAVNPESFVDPADDWLEPTPVKVDADPVQDGMEIVPESVEAIDDLNELTVDELTDLAKELKLKGYSKLTKPDLINLIEDELKKIDDVNDEEGL